MSNKHILVLEDDPLLSLMWHFQLQSAGYHVIGCSTVSDALHYLEQAKPDVIVTDYYLPDDTGLAFLREVAEFYPNYHPKRILVTSNPWFDLSVSDQHHVDQTLVKPIMRDTMLELVQQPDEYKNQSKRIVP